MISALADIGKNWLCLPKCSFLFIRIRGHVRFHFILYPLVLNIKYLHHTLQVLVARFFCTAFLSQSAHFLQSAVTSQKIIILTIIFNSCSSPQSPPPLTFDEIFQNKKVSIPGRMRTARLLTGCKGYCPEGGGLEGLHSDCFCCMWYCYHTFSLDECPFCPVGGRIFCCAFILIG